MAIMMSKPDNISQQDWDAIEWPLLSGEVLERMKPVKEVSPQLLELVRKKRESNIALQASAIVSALIKGRAL